MSMDELTPGMQAAGKGLCVPGYVRTTDDGQGWMYSQAMMQVRSAVLSDSISEPAKLR